MSFKVDMTTSDVDKQLALLKFYPELMKKYFRPELYRSVSQLSNRIKPTIPFLSGKARSAFKSSVRGTGINMEGRVGWWGNDQPWYINIVEYGSKAHSIAPEKKAAGTHIFVKGAWKTRNAVNGISKRGFMAAGFSAMQPQIIANMAAASESVVKELAVP